MIGEFVEASETFAALYAETGTVQSNGGYVTPAPASAASNSPLPLPPHNFLLPPPPPTALQQHSTHQLESVGFPVVSKYPLETIHQIRSLISADVNQVIEKIPVYSRSAALAKRPVGFCEWQWPSLLLRHHFSFPNSFYQIICNLFIHLLQSDGNAVGYFRVHYRVHAASASVEMVCGTIESSLQAGSPAGTRGTSAFFVSHWYIIIGCTDPSPQYRT